MVKEAYPCRLYLISPPTIELDDFEKQLREAFSGGDVGAFQLRLKDTADADIYAAARRLLPICRDYEVAFIMNDRPDIVAELGLDGVHLGQDDLKQWSIKKTREMIGENAVIGVSCHASNHMAMEAGEQGADYVAFGAFYETQSKDPEKLKKYGVPTLDILSWWMDYAVLPSVAIGGMTPENCQPMVTAGADFIAVISAVWNHHSGPKQAVSEFNEAIRLALKKRPAPQAA